MKTTLLKGLVIVSVGILGACRPAQKDPEFDFKHNRHDAKVENLNVEADNPLQAIGAPLLWKRTTGRQVDGGRVKIALVGSGIDYTNPDLRDALWINLGEYGDDTRANGRDDDGNGYRDDIFGYDFYSGDGMPYDWNGHDTFTASLIAATARKNAHVVGVAPNAELIVARYIGPDGRGNGFDAVEAIYYAIQNQAKIIYFNWPEGGFDSKETPLILGALKDASDLNILVVTPAGNSGNQTIPAFLKAAAKIPNVIIVAGLDRDGKIKSSSNSGKGLATTAAPSVGAIAYLPGSQISNDIQTTSVAAAYVTGAIALLSTLPELGNAQKIRMALLGSAIDKRSPQREPMNVLSDGALFIGNF
jgi:hypothetical protein